MTVRPVFGRTGRVRPIDLIAVLALVSGLVFTAQAEVWWVSVDVIPESLGRAASTSATSGAETDYWSLHLTRTGGTWLVDREQQDRPAPPW